jgi:hypothetical protein
MIDYVITQLLKLRIILLMVIMISYSLIPYQCVSIERRYSIKICIVPQHEILFMSKSHGHCC